MLQHLNVANNNEDIGLIPFGNHFFFDLIEDGRGFTRVVREDTEDGDLITEGDFAEFPEAFVFLGKMSETAKLIDQMFF